MGWTDRQVRRLSTAARLTLLAAVLAGLFGMHVLTAEDGSSGHGGLPMINTSGHADMTGPAPSTADPMPVVMGHLLVGSMPGIAAVLSAEPGWEWWSRGDGRLHPVPGHRRRRVDPVAAPSPKHLKHRTGPAPVPGPVLTEIRRRGPPGRWPRLALCVIRV